LKKQSSLQTLWQQPQPEAHVRGGVAVWNQPESKALERWKSSFHLLPEKG